MTFVYRYVAITFDSWSSRRHDSYTAVTGHYILGVEHKSVILQLVQSGPDHRASTVSSTIQKLVLDEYFPDRSQQIVCAITDNAANMKATATALQIKHMGCFAHSVQLVVNKSLAQPIIPNEDVDDDDVER